MSVDVNNESGVAVDLEVIAGLAGFVLESLRIHPLAELSVLLVDVETMTRLHVQWMDEPGPTDVLSFPMDELRPGSQDREPEPGLLGDVVLCPEVADTQARQAARAGQPGHSMQDELQLICVHGILHLLGYDHAQPDEEREMFGLQRELLTRWNEGQSTANLTETHP
jgi:probable rRNA maturation factor